MNKKYALSAIQQSYLLGRSSFSDDVIGCHTYTEFQIPKSVHLDIDQLNNVWNELLKIHPMLRMHIDNSGHQFIEDFKKYSFIQESDKKSVRNELSNKIYKQTDYPLYTIKYSIGKDATTLYFSIDSLITDAFSAGLLFQEIYDAYHNKVINSENQLYFDWLSYRQEHPNLKSIDYWDDKLKFMHLNSNPLKKRAASNKRFRQKKVINNDIFKDITEFCKKNNLLPSALFIYVFSQVMMTYLQCNELNIVNTLANRQPLNNKEVNCVGPLTNTEIVNVSAEKSLSNLNDEMYLDLDHSIVDLSKLLQNRKTKINLPFVVTVNLDSNTNMYKTFEVSQTPNVALENIIIVENNNLNWEINYSEEYFKESEIRNLLDLIADKLVSIIGKKNNTDIKLSELQEGYASDILNYGKCNYVVRTFDINKKQLDEINFVFQKIGAEIPFLTYSIKNVKKIVTSNGIVKIKGNSVDEIVHNFPILTSPIGFGIIIGAVNKLVVMYSMVYLNASSILYLSSQIYQLLQGKHFKEYRTKSLITEKHNNFSKQAQIYWKNKFKNTSSDIDPVNQKNKSYSPNLEKAELTFGMWNVLVQKCQKLNINQNDLVLTALATTLFNENFISNDYCPILDSSKPNVFESPFQDNSIFTWINIERTKGLIENMVSLANTRKEDHQYYFDGLLKWLRNQQIKPNLDILITNCLGLTTDSQSNSEFSNSSGATLDIIINTNENGLYIEWNYNSSYINKDQINQLEYSFKSILISFIEQEDNLMIKKKDAFLGAQENEYSVNQMRSYLKSNTNLSKNEFKNVIYNFNDFEHETPDELIYEGFDRSVNFYPEKIALISDTETLTYQELDKKVNNIATNIMQEIPDLSENVIIGIAMDQSINMIASLLAILKLNCTYLPINVTDGINRVNVIIDTASPVAIISDNTLQTENINAEVLDISRLITDINDASKLIKYSKGNSDNLAYIIFTSGSTGKPKGVQIRHKSVSNLFYWMNSELNLGNNEVTLAVNPINFDLSVFDIFGTLFLGSTIRILSSKDRLDIFKIVDIIKNEKITIWNSAPAYLKMILNEMQKSNLIVNSIKHVFLSGDWIPVKMISTIQNLFPNSHFIALGGATEATVWSNYFDTLNFNENMESVPYGKPIWNTKYYILKDDFSPSHIGEVGNLFISGKCLSTGYTHNNDKNKNSFLPNPYETREPYKLMYKTGDLAKYLPDGTIVFCGREDNQIEINGYRVELGEIDSCFHKLGINDAISIFINNQIYVITENNYPENKLTELKELSKNHLSKYMVPSKIIHIPEVPVTNNGKVDRKKLTSLVNGLLNNKKQNNTLEVKSNQTNNLDIIKDSIIDMCSNISDSTITDEDHNSNLGDLGFASLQFALLSSEINQKFNIKINPALFYKYDTIEKIANYIQNSTTSQKDKDDNKHEEKAENSFSIETSYLDDDIAIVGLSARMPDAEDEIEFFNELLSKKDTVQTIPSDRWNWQEYDGLKGKYQVKTKVKYGHFMNDINSFDYSKFNLSPKEARMLDPRQRILLEEIDNLIIKSGYTSKELNNEDIGVFIGATGDEFYNLLINQNKNLNPYSMTGTSRTMLANRISYTFNWNGPSEVVDTACSSSLVALHNAVLAIKNNDCSRAIVSGINVILDPLPQIGLDETGVLSADGKCKTLDKTADGYGRGEGVGSIFIETVKKAKENNDNILCVVKKTAVNHGGKANSLTSPNIPAQVSLLEKVYSDSNLDISKLRFIELHGTGTALGDPIEIEALKEFFDNQVKPYSIGLGSVKTNIGHLEAAAGIASVIKCVMAYRTGVFPPNINLQNINDNIDLDNTPFYPIKQNEKLPYNKKIDMGISSFGFGGTNAHILLEGINRNAK